MAPQSSRAAEAKQGPASVAATRSRGLTILLVDARAWTREALAHALETAGRDLRVRRIGDVADLATEQSTCAPTVVLLNVTGLPLADARVSSVAAAARSCLPGVPVVALSDSQDTDDILSVIEQGLSGYIPISLELKLLIEALRFVAAGGIFIPAEPILSTFDTVASGVADADPALADPRPAPLTADRAVLITLLKEMTPRELSVLDLLREGFSNKQIGRELDISEATVKVHVRHIMRKLGATNRTQAALLAEQLKNNIASQEQEEA